MAWCPGNNAAIMSDLFPQRLHPLSFAMQFWVEGTVSAFGPFLCAVLNDRVFQTGDLAKPQAIFKSFSIQKQEALLRGFGMSILTVCCVGWLLCAAAYAPAYWSYPRESLFLRGLKNKKEDGGGDDCGGTKGGMQSGRGRGSGSGSREEEESVEAKMQRSPLLVPVNGVITANSINLSI